MFNEILHSKWFTVIALIVAGFLVISFLKIEPALVATNKELNNLDKKIAEVKRSASELERLGDYLNSDAYFERQARLKLNYKKPDEKVVYVYQKTQDSSVEAVNNVVRPSKIFESKYIKNLKSWWEYLADKRGGF